MKKYLVSIINTENPDVILMNYKCVEKDMNIVDVTMELLIETNTVNNVYDVISYKVPDEYLYIFDSNNLTLDMFYEFMNDFNEDNVEQRLFIENNSHKIILSKSKYGDKTFFDVNAPAGYNVRQDDESIYICNSKNVDVGEINKLDLFDCYIMDVVYSVDIICNIYVMRTLSADGDECHERYFECVDSDTNEIILTTEHIQYDPSENTPEYTDIIDAEAMDDIAQYMRNKYDCNYTIKYQYVK